MVVSEIDGVRDISQGQNRETNNTLPTYEIANLLIRVSFYWCSFLHLASLPLLPDWRPV
jgi:hypothetical protein